MRRLKLLKWLATLLCLALGIAHATAPSRCIAWIGKHHALGFGYGVVWCKIRYVTPPGNLGWYVGRWDAASNGWSFEYPAGSMFGLRRITPYTYEVRISFLLIPLAILSAALWYRDLRPIPPHCCRACRYDLRGTPPAPDGVLTCPECGTISAPIALASRQTS